MEQQQNNTDGQEQQQQQKKPYKSLKTFYNNEFLSDIKVTDPILKKTYNLHKLALASKSNYFYDLLQNQKENSVISETTIPKYVNSTFQKNEFSELVVDGVIRNFYQDNPMECLQKNGLETHNCFIFYSVAQALEMRETQFVIENYIIDHMGTDIHSATGMLKDAIKLENPRIAEMAKKLIASQFQQVLENQQMQDQLMEIPLEDFKQIVQNDHLNVKNETEIIKIVQKYVEHKQNLEENPKNVVIGGEENGEQKKDEKVEEQPPSSAQEENQQVEKKEENAEEKQENREKDLEIQALQKVKLFKLSEAEKEELLNSVRLNFVENEDLLKASQAPIFEPYRNQFMQAISSKLQQIENPQKEFQVPPRECYKQGVMFQQSQLLKSKQIIEQSNQNLQSQNNIIGTNTTNNNNFSQQQLSNTNQQKPNLQVNTGFNNNTNNINNNNAQNQLEQSRYVDEGTSPIQNMPYQQFNYNNNSNRQNDHIREQKNQNQNSYDNSPTGRHNISGQLVQNHNQNSYLNPSNNFSKKLNNGGKGSQLQFNYQKDFDKNGVFYYLGSAGSTTTFQNPHNSGQCKVFCSSLRTGRIQDFVSREVTNLSTNNEKNSYFGVDIGSNRYVFPTSYTIRNRNSTTHVCFNWCLEGSVDGVDWYVIDKRINYSETNQRFNAMMENERKMLVHRGASTTWGIDSTALSKFFAKHYQKEKGFRMFKITQLFENSHGSDNLCLSGLEIYGDAYGDRWTFE